MRRLSALLAAVLLAGGCSREDKAKTAVAESEVAAPVKAAIYRICRLERTSPSEHSARVIDVKGMTAREFRRVLTEFPGREVHVWMPGESRWLLIGNQSTNAVSLARAMEEFANDETCTMSLPEVFASYAGTRTDILPAFDAPLKGTVVPEWFVTREIPQLDWLDTTGVDEDVLKSVLAEIRSMQVVRREILKGNMLAAKATDKAGEERATDIWARAALRNPNDPLLLERIDNLNRNAKGFLAVGRLLQAMKCYETLVLIRPNDAVAVHNFGMCLKKLGKLDLAEQVLARARQLSGK
ncbi:MAG: hypothetical protein ACI4RD_10885 [Kiritimatiellia bacterium]